MATPISNANNRVTLPDQFSESDLRTLSEAVTHYDGASSEDKQRLEPLLQVLAHPFKAKTESESIDPEAPRVYRLGDLLEEWDKYAEDRYAARQGEIPLGIKTGLKSVDEVIGGVFQPGLHSIQGGPGIGKTAFALQVAATCGFPALYVTCEMDPLELMRRITARVTGTYLGKFKSGELEPGIAKAQVRKAIATCPNLAILDATCGYIPAFESDTLKRNRMNLYDLAEDLREDSPHLLVVVDSLHAWSDKAETGDKEYDRLNMAIGSLRSLASALSCPVLVIAERNRQSMNSGGLSGGAGTRKIEYSAESVIELDSDGNGPDASLETGVTLKLSKNRNGIMGKGVDLKFNGAQQRFREV